MKNIFLVFFFFGGITAAFSQSRLELSLGGVAAFHDRTPEIHHQTAQPDFTGGFQVGALYGFRFRKSPWEAIGGAGFKQLRFSGKLGNSDYFGQTNKLVLNFGGRYWHRPFLGFSAGLQWENNRELEDFRTQTSDIFRTNATVQILYKTYGPLGFQLGYVRALSPLEDAYLIFNPANQLQLGAFFQLL